MKTVGIKSREDRERKEIILRVEKLEKAMEYFDGYGSNHDELIIELCEEEKENLKKKPCHYCLEIDQTTLASPRKKYIYCPMCSKKRIYGPN